MRLTPNQAQRPPEEPAYLRKLREEDPERYQLEKAREIKLQQQSAGLYMLTEELDRERFMRKFGDEGATLLPQIEQQLDQLRRQGFHGHTRESILKLLKGEETLQKRTKPAPQPPVENQETAQVVPPSSPKAAAVVGGGSAAPTKALTLAELEAALENQEF